MTTATLSRRFIRPMATRPARRSMLVGFSATLALGLLVLVGASVGVAVSAGSTSSRGVNVAGVELSGLDRSAAACGWERASGPRHRRGGRERR